MYHIGALILLFSKEEMFLRKPNVLLILCDQFRKDCLSILGHPTVRTPHLDALAAQGTLFASAYSAVPSCIAARATLFTGMNPEKTGFLGYQDGVEWNYRNMLPQLLRDSGYQTHCCGKTHFYPQRKLCGFEGLDSNEGCQKLNDYYCNDYFEWLREKTDGETDFYSHGLSDNSWIARASTLPEELHDTTWTVTRALEFMKRRDHTRPYFLNVSFHRPHPPIDPPQFYWDEYMKKPFVSPPVGDWAKERCQPVYDPDGWCGVLDADNMKSCRHGYFAQIAHIDTQIGRLLQRLQMMGEMPDLILFTSDHGEMLWDHNLFRKTYAYEGSAGIPMILWLKNGDKGGSCRQPVTLQDVYTTILEFCGVPVPEEADGQNLLPACYGESLPRKYVHGEHSPCYSREEAMQYITDGIWKYIWFTASGKEQLFCLEKDPQELHDLSKDPDSQEILERYREILIEELSRRPQDGLVENGKLKPGCLPAFRPCHQGCYGEIQNR